MKELVAAVEEVKVYSVYSRSDVRLFCRNGNCNDVREERAVERNVGVDVLDQNVRLFI